jgi:hypothetical protein
MVISADWKKSWSRETWFARSEEIIIVNSKKQ